MKKKSFRKENTPIIWNTHKEGGWKKYYDLTTNSPELDAIAEETKKLDSEELMTRYSRRMEKIKFQSFGKVKRKISSMKNDKELSLLYEEKIKKNDDINDDIDDRINSDS